MSRPVSFGAALGALALLAGCAIGPMPSASTTTASPAWEHYFKISYNVASTGETRTVDGYVMNEYGVAMQNVRLLVQALDAASNVVAQRLVYVPGGIPGFGRSYFEVRNMPPADKYNVTVWAFDRVESPSSTFP